MYLKSLILTFIILLLTAGAIFAQPVGGNVNIFDRNRSEVGSFSSYDAIEEYFRKQSDKEKALNDSINIEKRLRITPKELEKLGASEEILDEIQEINDLQDTLQVAKEEKRIALLKEKYGEEYVDSLDYDEVNYYLEKRKEDLIKKALELPEPYIYGHNFFRRSVLDIFFNKNLNERIPDNYIVDEGDRINITTWGNNYETNRIYSVDRDGAIYPDLIGQVILKGLTYKQSQQIIQQKYAKALQIEPNTINVSMTHTRIVSANFVGELFHPGTYSFPPRTSVFNMLVAINGPTQLGSVRNIFIKRNGETIKTLDVYQYLNNPDSNQEFYLNENDYVVVPTIGKVVHISGQVRRPHNYEVLDSEGLLDLVAYAGGLDGGAFTKSVSIKRYQNNYEVLLNIDLDSLQRYNIHYPLFNGDSIFVNKIPGQLRNYVAVEGAVRVPGSYQIRKGDRIKDILDKSQGILPEDANMERAYILRTTAEQNRKIIPFSPKEIMNNTYSPQNIVLQNMDTIQVISAYLSRESIPVKVFGAVLQPGDYEFAEGLTLKDLLFWSGGLRKEAANNRIEVSRLVIFTDETSGIKKNERIIVKKLEINPDLSIDQNSENFVLQPYDHIFIRSLKNFEEQQIIKLYGEINYPGEYALTNKEERVSSVIKRAGGFSPHAFRSGAKLYRNQDSTGYVLLDLSFGNTDTWVNAKNPLKRFLQKKEVELDRAKQKRYNYILSAGDSLYIPKMTNIVTLSGAMAHFELDTLGQVSTPFVGNRRANYYVNRYGGGFSRFSKKSRTYVQQPNGEVDRARNYVLFNVYPKVKNGATIVVDITDRKRFEPERLERRKERNWNEAFDSVTAKVATVFTLLLLATQIQGAGN